MEHHKLNINSKIMLSLLTCLRVKDIVLIMNEFGLEGVSAIIVFNSYFYVNHLKVGYKDNLDTIASKYFGEKGRIMLKRFFESKILEVRNNGMISPGGLYSVIQLHETPCFYEIYRLKNLNKNDISFDYSNIINDNKIIFEKCLSETHKSLPYYISEIIRNDTFKNYIYTAVYYYLKHSVNYIGNITDINIIARCLEMNWSDIIRIIKEDGLVVLYKDNLHFYIPKMRKCEGLSGNPKQYEIYEAVKNYDRRYIYIYFKNKQL